MIFNVDDYQIVRAEDRLPGGGMPLAEAAMYCQFLDEDGYRTWRLPTTKELYVILADQLQREQKRDVRDLELHYWALDDLNKSTVYPNTHHWVWPVREV